MKLFRWQGLVVFTVLAVLVWGFLFFFLDGLIKRSLEDHGSEILQTEIEVASISTSLPSQSISIEGLAVANPDNLWENLFEIDAIRFNVDAGRGIRRKVVIDDMTVDGIRLNQKRKEQGKAYRSPESKEEGGEGGEKGKEMVGLPSLQGLDIKSPEEILKSEKLETLEAAAAAKKEIQSLKAKWEEKFKNELSPKALEDVKQQIADLQEKTKGPTSPAEIPAALQKFQSLQKEIQGNLENIKNLKTELEQDTRRVKQLVANLKDLPQKDFERLKNKYSLDVKGGTNLIGVLLGGEIKEKMDMFWSFYQKISPYLGGKEGAVSAEEEKYVRGKGINVKFKEAEPFPDFLVRHAKLSMEFLGSRVAGELRDFSDNQRVYGKPAVMEFRSDRDERFDLFALNLKLNRTQPVFNDSIDAEIQALKLENVDLGEGMGINKGLANLKSALEIVGEKEVSGFIQADLKQVSLSLPQSGKNELLNTVYQTLSTADQINFKVSIGGTIDNYNLDIESNLDQLVANAVRKAFSEKLKNFEGSLKKSIGSATAGPLGNVNESLSSFLGTEKILKNNESSWSGLLDQAKEGLPGAPAPKKLPLPGGLKLPF